MSFASKSTSSVGLKIYLITLVFIILSLFLQTIAIVTSDHFVDKLSLDSSEFIFMTSLFFITYSIMQVPAGMLFDRYGLKYILPISIGIVLIGLPVFWYAHNSFMIGLGRLITGFGCATAYISSIYTAASFFHHKRLPLLIALAELATSIGSLSAAQPLNNLLTTLGWNLSGIIIICICMLLLISAILTSRKLESKKNTVFIPIKETIKNSFSLFTNQTFLFILFYSFFTWFIIMSFAGFWLKDYMSVVHNYSARSNLILVDTYWISFSLSSVIIGFFTKNHSTTIRSLLLMAAVCFATYLIMSIPIVFNYIQVILVIVFAGISAAGVNLAFATIPRIIDPKYTGIAVAINNTFLVAGGYVGQLVFGLALKHINIADYYSIPDPKLEPHYYAGLLCYLLASTVSLIFALLIYLKSRIYSTQSSLVPG